MDYLKKLVGHRLFLSPKTASDDEAERFSTWLNDFQITDYIGMSHTIVTYANEKDFLDKSVTDTNNIYFNIVELNKNKLVKPRLLGSITLKNFNWISRYATLEIYIGDKEYRGSDYGIEAICLLLEYGFKYLNLNSINLSLLSTNTHAHKCYLKCGFKDSGCAREAIFLNGKYYDRIYMDILASDFKGDYIQNKNVK